MSTLPQTMQAVRFDDYGDTDVLEVREADVPALEPGHVLVAVRATAINPGEASIRAGALAEIYPSTFPSGEGSDLAGDVVVVGPGVDGFAPGDAVFGWTDERGAHAQFVSVPATQLAHKPGDVTYEQAGSLFVAGGTAVKAVEAVKLTARDTVVIAGAAGGVGVFTTQLAVRTGARVIALASEANHAWLREQGAIPVAYGDGMAPRIRDAAPNGVDAFVDLFGGGYVDLALDELGVSTGRVNTIIDFPAVQARGILGVGGAEADIHDLVGLADLIAAGDLDLPIAQAFPLAEVRAAFKQLAERHTRGKLVLLP